MGKTKAASLTQACRISACNPNGKSPVDSGHRASNYNAGIALGNSFAAAAHSI
jgi:hypothetical protein